MTKPFSKKALKSRTCVRDKKQAVHQVEMDSEWKPLCRSCAVAFQRTVLEFLDVDEIDEKMLEFRESL